MVANNSWKTILKEEYNKKYFKELMKFIKEEYNNKIIYPKEIYIFRAFELTNYKDIKVVIIGQDPYHNEGEAEGLAFSVPKTINPPPSLANIYKELQSDLGINRTNGNLEDWAKQGVLLLNSVLTVEKNAPNSHKGKGWEVFTNKVIELINKKEDSVVFLLWGNHAKSKSRLINNSKHLVIESSHPSPLSYFRGFKGSRPFSKANHFLQKNNKKKIKW